MSAKSFTNSLVAALAIVSVTAASVAPAFASDRGFEVKPVRSNKVNKSALAIGALVGLGGALLGAAAAHSQPRHADERYAPQRPVRFIDHDDEEEDCFEKPIKRFDRYSGETIVIGHKTVCR
ncbi:MAG: hypothetical protein K2Z25_16245 [Beijerinckiaceae bacterium]|nr:hypothetical protein [Beijerinckiaceae bacterium]